MTGKHEGKATMIHVADVIFNGKAVSQETLRTMVSSLSDRNVLTEKGGFIFKSRIDGATLRLGVLPWFVDGARTYHYNIDIGESKFNLVGLINSNYSITILFKPTREDHAQGLADDDREMYLRQYAGLAGLLVSAGFPPDVPLDPLSGDALRDSGICRTPPRSLGELARLGS